MILFLWCIYYLLNSYLINLFQKLYYNRMVEEVEPNQLLIKYYQLSKTQWTEFDSSKDNFLANEEWHYVMSNIEQNIFLLQRLDERGLLLENNQICDCGIGLGVALFDIYLQSKLFNDGKKFFFTGIEKEKTYLDFLKNKLLDFWQNNLTVVDGDIMDFDYSNFNIVYCFTPFKTLEKLRKFYQKVIEEISSGALLIENKNAGIGIHGILTELSGVKKVEIDDIVVFQKI